MKRYKLKVNEKFHIRTFERTGKRQIARKSKKGSKKIAVFISGCEMGSCTGFRFRHLKGAGSYLDNDCQIKAGSLRYAPVYARRPFAMRMA